MTKSNLRAVDNNQPHARDIARAAITEFRRAKAIDPDYDFSAAPRQMRQVIYSMCVKYSAQHSLLSRLLRR